MRRDLTDYCIKYQDFFHKIKLGEHTYGFKYILTFTGDQLFNNEIRGVANQFRNYYQVIINMNNDIIPKCPFQFEDIKNLNKSLLLSPIYYNSWNDLNDHEKNEDHLVWVNGDVVNFIWQWGSARATSVFGKDDIHYVCTDNDIMKIFKGFLFVFESCFKVYNIHKK